ncbi:copper homeostasis membrane protein CopD [Caulobacter sp. BK020]|uniref:copper homeostasis membrane protein CopD n=1 Tax=Caulobacter sp. BK020 TaxID=2512117 RepID=UPI0010431F3C|nr:copper homeostasis membrane protein CopD [Caulobacter sp. BK020]TCS14142.1 putative copper resistance protein D [Caulobacter sp. BK020]
MEAAVVVLRWVQYAASFVLAGGALFALYALPARGPSSAAAMAWPRRVLAGSAAILLLATALGLSAQTAVVAGSLSAALAPATLASVLTDMAMGPASVARGLSAALALGLLLAKRPGTPAWVASSSLGAVATASLAWMGHGAATEGAGSLIHLAADIAHLAAAAVWIGAIVFFLILARLADGTDADGLGAFHDALAGFSGIGSALVAVLLATGLVNSGFLVGMAGLPGLFTTLYGRLLLLKLLVFAAMLVLAAANRFRLTPALRGALDDPDRAAAAVVALRKSLALETGAALAVLALVAWLGRLAPLSSL